MLRRLVYWAGILACATIPVYADTGIPTYRGTVIRFGSRNVEPEADTDADGIPDAWEVLNDLDPSNPDDGWLDLDGDGLTAADEYHNGTSPWLLDSDGDAVPDGVEVFLGLDAAVWRDTDGDGIADDWERASVGTVTADPRSDSDGDGLSLAEEWVLGRDPFAVELTSASSTGAISTCEVFAPPGMPGAAGWEP